MNKSVLTAWLGSGLILGTLAYYLWPKHIDVEAQSVQNGQQIITCANGACALDPSYTAGYIQLTANVTSMTIPAGSYGAKPYHLTVCQGSGGPYTASGIGANMTGDTSLASTGCSFYRMIWDVPTSAWITTRIGIPPGVGPVGPQGPKGDTGSAGANGTNGAVGAQGPQGIQGMAGTSGTTYVGTGSVSQTATVAIALGPRTVATTVTGAVSGGIYFVSPTSAPPTGYGVYANGQGTAANTVQITVYGPALAIGQSYSIPVSVWKMN